MSERRKTATIAACLIARNSSATIERFIASVRPHVDEVCVWLGGESSDGTPAILERLASEPGWPIRVVQGVWRAAYAAARNSSFAMASSDYLAWFDDDEVLEGGAWLREAVRSERPELVYMQRVEVRRVQVNRQVDGPQQVREAGDTVIVPVVEEVLQVQKHWILKEEIHITRVFETEPHEETVTVRREEAQVEKVDSSGGVTANIPAPVISARDEGSPGSGKFRTNPPSIVERGKKPSRSGSPGEQSILSRTAKPRK